jgi:hypothetical protein
MKISSSILFLVKLSVFAASAHAGSLDGADLPLAPYGNPTQASEIAKDISVLKMWVSNQGFDVDTVVRRGLRPCETEARIWNYTIYIKPLKLDVSAESKEKDKLSGFINLSVGDCETGSRDSVQVKTIVLYH